MQELTGAGRPEVLSTLAAKVTPEHCALLVIDMLNDFLDPRGKTAARANRPLDDGRAVIPRQAQLIADARAAGVRVIYVCHTTPPGYAGVSGAWLDARSRATYSVEDLCLTGSWGADVIGELTPAEPDLIVRKYRYSGFGGTNLDLVLRSLGVKTVICAGVSTNACVEATAREAFSLDYYVVFAGDCCASWIRALHEATLETAAHRYAVVATARELREIWNG